MLTIYKQVPLVLYIFVRESHGNRRRLSMVLIV
jgi:hypothetical protein